MAGALNAAWDPTRGREATPQEATRIRELKEHFAELRAHILGATPPSREQSFSLTHLEDACMWATRAVLVPPPQTGTSVDALARANEALRGVPVTTIEEGRRATERIAAIVRDPSSA